MLKTKINQSLIAFQMSESEPNHKAKVKHVESKINHPLTALLKSESEQNKL